MSEEETLEISNCTFLVGEEIKHLKKDDFTYEVTENLNGHQCNIYDVIISSRQNGTRPSLLASSKSFSKEMKILKDNKPGAYETLEITEEQFRELRDYLFPKQEEPEEEPQRPVRTRRFVLRR
jgi:hypothetical protein